MPKSAFSKLIHSDKPVLIDFFATWCGPCQTLFPILKELKSDMGDKVRIIKIDIDKNQDLTAKLGVRSVPTIMIYQNGDQKWRTQGVQTKALMEKKLSDLL